MWSRRQAFAISINVFMVCEGLAAPVPWEVPGLGRGLGSAGLENPGSTLQNCRPGRWLSRSLCGRRHPRCPEEHPFLGTTKSILTQGAAQEGIQGSQTLTTPRGCSAPSRQSCVRAQRQVGTEYPLGVCSRAPGTVQQAGTGQQLERQLSGLCREQGLISSMRTGSWEKRKRFLNKTSFSSSSQLP